MLNTLVQSPESAVFLASIVESFDDSIITLDRDARILSWNRGAEHLYGYSSGEAVGCHISLLIHPDDIALVLDAMHRVSVGEHVPPFEMERVRKDGSGVTVSVKLSAVRDHKGRFIGVASLSRDITEQKHDREALRQSEARFRMLTETIPQLVWTCSPDGSCDYISPQWGRYTGIPSEQQLGHKWAEAVHPDDRDHMRNCWQAAVNCEAPFDLEYRLRDAKGHYRWFQVRGAPIRDEEGHILKWFGTCTDIESSKREQEKLERLVAERTADLRATIKELETFSYSMAHDMRAPLRAMSSFAHILHEQYAACLDNRGLEMTTRISAAAERLDLLIVDVLNYTRVIKDRVKLSPIDLQRFVEELIATAPQWSPPRAHVQIEGKLPPVVGHKGFLTQCFSNLLDNAVKFVPPATFPQVVVSAQGDGHLVHISIHDNGIGIDQADQPRIFKMFERLNAARDYPGTGMGLAIVHAAVERMGGQIGVDSHPGHGSTFWLELKAA